MEVKELKMMDLEVEEVKVVEVEVTKGMEVVEVEKGPLLFLQVRNVSGQASSLTHQGDREGLTDPVAPLLLVCVICTTVLPQPSPPSLFYLLPFLFFCCFSLCFPFTQILSLLIPLLLGALNPDGEGQSLGGIVRQSKTHLFFKCLMEGLILKCFTLSGCGVGP